METPNIKIEENLNIPSVLDEGVWNIKFDEFILVTPNIPSKIEFPLIDFGPPPKISCCNCFCLKDKHNG